MQDVKIISVKPEGLSLQIRWSFCGNEYCSIMYSKTDGSWGFDPDTRSISNDGLNKLKAALIVYLCKVNVKAPKPIKEKAVFKNPSVRKGTVSVWRAN